MKSLISFVILLNCFLYTATAQQEYVAELSDKVDRTSSTLSSSSSSIYFRFLAMDQSSYLKEIEVKDAGKHFLGDYMAKKKYLLKKRYSYKEPIAPGSSATKTIYRKPDIYFSVAKIEKYLKDEVKNETLSAEIAKEDFNKVLDVALNILEEDTESLERRINSVNGNSSKLLKIFVYEVALDK